MGFWKNVEKEIEFRCVTRKELSFLSNVPMTTINRAIERDSRVFAEDALRIARALGVSVEFLLGVPELMPGCSCVPAASLDVCLCRKYCSVIKALEAMPEGRRNPLRRMIEEIE